MLENHSFALRKDHELLSIFLCPPNHQLNKKDRFFIFLALFSFVAFAEIRLFIEEAAPFVCTNGTEPGCLDSSMCNLCDQKCKVKEDVSRSIKDSKGNANRYTAQVHGPRPTAHGPQIMTLTSFAVQICALLQQDWL